MDNAASDHNELADKNTIVPASESADLADEWSSSSDDNEPTVPASNTLVSVSAGTHLSTNLIPTVPLESNNRSLADQWSSATEEDTTERDIADEWSLASDDHLNRLANEWSSASDTERDLAEEGSLASDISESSLLTVNSQMAVSPTQITLDRPLDDFLLFQDWPAINSNDQFSHSPHNHTLEIHSPGRGQQYGPMYFNFLQDHMFTDDISESEEEDE